MTEQPETDRQRETRPSEPPFSLLEVTHELVVDDASSSTITTRDEYVIQVTKQCRFFEHRYRWSGAGVEIDPIIESPNKLHGPLLRSGDTTIFLIAFDRDLQPGDRERVAFTQEFIDRLQQFKPFLGKAVHLEIDRLTLRVGLPDELIGYAKPCVHPIGEPPVHMSSPPPFDWSLDRDNGVCELVSAAPNVGTRYAIQWDKDHTE